MNDQGKHYTLVLFVACVREYDVVVPVPESVSNDTSMVQNLSAGSDTGYGAGAVQSTVNPMDSVYAFMVDHFLPAYMNESSDERHVKLWISDLAMILMMILS